jgi:hypothetical protein
LPPQGPSRGNPIQDYVTVAERIERFYERYPDGRIITNIIEHDAERGFILMRADVYRNPEDALPAATGHAFELRSEGYVQRTSYIEVGETSAVGRALAMCGFEVKRGIASREEMDKAARMGNQEPAPRETAPREAARETARETTRETGRRETPKAEKTAAAPAPAAKAEQPRPAQSKAEQSATDEQKQNILNLLEELRPGDRRAQRTLLKELTGKESRDDLTDQEARSLIYKLKREANRNSI